ncbi:MAG: hypothetical protein AB7V53_14105, partial [Dongiaceae bacterium]
TNARDRGEKEKPGDQGRRRAWVVMAHRHADWRQAPSSATSFANGPPKGEPPGATKPYACERVAVRSRHPGLIRSKLGNNGRR